MNINNQPQVSTKAQENNSFELLEKLPIEEQQEALILLLSPDQNLINDFADYITTNPKTKLWTNLTRNLEYSKLSLVFIDVIRTNYFYDIRDQITYLKKLINSKIRDMLSEHEYADCWGMILGLLNKFIDFDNLTKDTSLIVTFLKALFKQTKEIRDTFVESISNLLNHCIHKINLEPVPPDDITKFNPDSQLAYVYAIIAQLLFDADISHIANLDSTYLTSTLCHILWYDENPNQPEEETNFFTKLFFLMLDFHRILIIPAFERARSWGEIFSSLEKEMRPYLEMKKSNPKLKAPSALEAEYKFVKQVLEDDKAIVQHHDIINWGWKLYYYFSLWVNKHNPDIMLDPILEDLVVFVENTHIDEADKDDTDILVVKELLKMTANLVTRSSIIKQPVNPDTRKKLITNIINKYAEYLDSSQDNLTKIILGLLEIILEFDKMDAHALYKFYNKIELYTIIDHLGFNEELELSTENFIEVLNLVLGKNPEMAQRFVSVYLDDINELLSFISNFIPNIGKNMISQMHMSFKPIEQVIYDELSQLSMLLDILHELTQLANFKLVLGSPELAPMLGSLVNILVKILVQDLGLSTDFVSQNYIKKKYPTDQVNIINMLCTLHEICAKLLPNSNLLTQIVSEDLIFNQQNYDIWGDLVGSQDFVGLLTKTKTQVDAILLEDVPEEFTDRLTEMPIRTPVLLPYQTPEERIFLDRSTIIRALLKKEENPFNRSSLTVKELDDYNKKPEVLSQLKDFKKRLAKWRKSK